MTRRRFFRPSRWALLLLIAALLAVVADMYFPAGLFPAPEHRVILVQRGQTLHQVADELKRVGLLSGTLGFQVLARGMRLDRDIKAGQYSFQLGTSVPALLKALARGMSGLNVVTIPEGLTMTEISLLLSNHLGVPVAEFDSLAHDRTFLDSLGITAPSIEGYLAPDSYEFLPGTSPEVAYRTMAHRTQDILLRLAAGRDSLPLGLSLHQVLTLASIVEAEAMADVERPRIAAVYLNRLQMGMRLQADPTVGYAIGRGPRVRLLLRHLKVDSPFNTYLYEGLPPGPICNPGRASIASVIDPLPGLKELYFVADGYGRHMFSNTYEEHLAKIRMVRSREEPSPDSAPARPRTSVSAVVVPPPAVVPVKVPTAAVAPPAALGPAVAETTAVHHPAVGAKPAKSTANSPGTTPPAAPAATKSGTKKGGTTVATKPDTTSALKHTAPTTKKRASATKPDTATKKTAAATKPDTATKKTAGATKTKKPATKKTTAPVTKPVAGKTPAPAPDGAWPAAPPASFARQPAPALCYLSRPMSADASLLHIAEPGDRPFPDLDWRERLERLRAWIAAMGEVVVAYSGGVDSSLVLRVAHEVLGERAHGVIGRSDSYAARELALALEQAAAFGAIVQVVATGELSAPSSAPTRSPAATTVRASSPPVDEVARRAGATAAPTAPSPTTTTSAPPAPGATGRARPWPSWVRQGGWAVRGRPAHSLASDKAGRPRLLAHPVRDRDHRPGAARSSRQKTWSARSASGS
jgi:UPF0755 protein